MNPDQLPYDEPTEDGSPYAAPDVPEQHAPRTSPSVFDEPWMRAATDFMEPADEHASGLTHSTAQVDSEHSVWDEPGLSRELSGETPDDATTWFRRYLAEVQQTNGLESWAVTLGVAVVAGLGAVLGSMLLQLTNGTTQLVMTVVGAPITEEIMKIVFAIWIVEKRPWLFRSPVQILICGLAGGLVFAAIENLLYLNVYTRFPSQSLVQWRWSVCVLLHCGCSVVASLGLVRIWRRFQDQQRPPQLADGASWITAAMCIHGAYNGGAVLAVATGYSF